MPKRSAKERVARLAGRQFGRISRGQLRAIGVSDATLRDWCDQGYFHRVLPHIYAVGHRAKTVESDLFAAILYAGPGAMLSHATAAWWVGLAISRPYMIHVSSPRRCRSISGIRVHQRRQLERTLHKNIPVTQFPQTMIDYAATASLSLVRLALARADYNGELNLKELEAALQPGRLGAAKLRAALKRHQPMLARARSRIEVRLFELCESAGYPLPELNADFGRWTIDALWRKEKIAIELDGAGNPGNHRSPAQIRRDRRKEFDLRAADFIMARYSDEQMDNQPGEIVAEIDRFLAQRRAAG